MIVNDTTPQKGDLWEITYSGKKVHYIKTGIITKIDTNCYFNIVSIEYLSKGFQDHTHGSCHYSMKTLQNKDVTYSFKYLGNKNNLPEYYL